MSRSDETSLQDRPQAFGGRIDSSSDVRKDVALADIYTTMLANAQRRQLISHTERSDSEPQQHGFIQGFMEAAAASIHVLSFYQGRLFEEGFLRTAREGRSIFEIAKLLGEERRPGLSAEAYCALTAVDIPGDGQPMEVPALMPVQSVPIKGGMPQVFETTHPLMVHPTWNTFELSPERPSGGPVLRGRSTAVVLRGIFPGLGTRVPLLIRGMVDGVENSWVRPVDRMARLTQKNLTILAWQEPLVPEHPDCRIEGLQIESFGPKVSWFGAQAEEWSTMALDKKVPFSEPIGGLLVQEKQDQDWSRRSLPGPLTALKDVGDGTMLAGVQGEGVYRWTVEAGWIQVQGPFRRSDVLCMGVDATGSLLMGTRDRGAYRSPDGGLTWNPLQGESSIVGAWPKVVRVDARLPSTPVRCILPCMDARGERPNVLVGTDAGVFAFDQIAGHWNPLNEGLPGWEPEAKEALTSVRAIVVNQGTGAVFCATDQGLFVRARLDRPWVPLNVAEQGAGIACLVANPAGVLFAGLDAGGLMVSEDNGANWVAVAGGDAPFHEAKVHQMVAVGEAGSEWLFAGTDLGLYRSTDRGSTWASLLENKPMASVHQVCVDSRGGLWASGPIVGVVDDEWPGFGLDPLRAVLSGNVSEINLGATALLEETSGEEYHWRVLRPKTRSTLKCTDFGLSERCTVVEWQSAIADGDDFDRRNATVRFGARVLRLSPNQFSNFAPIADLQTPLEPIVAEPTTFDAMLSLSMEVEDIPKSALFTSEILPSFDGRYVGVVGRRPRLVSSLPMQMEVGGTATTALASNLPLEVTGWPTATETDQLRWPVVDGLGQSGTVVPETGSWRLLPASPDQHTVTRVHRVQGTLRRHHGTHLELEKPLDVPFDLSDVQVMGNIVHVRHGMRVEEVLGNGDEMQAHQSFCLRQAPLSWISDAADLRPDIEIRVSGGLWSYRSSLFDAGPDDTVYSVSVDHDGNTWVRFGDGVQGARLPSGSDNVVASFRIGAGVEGNLEQGHIRLLQQRPPMVRQVLNLTPASGGQNPETPAAFRARLPDSLRAARRMVSLSDMEAHARQAAGVRQAVVDTVWDGTKPATCLTVLVDGQGPEGMGGEPVIRRLQDDLAQAEMGSSGIHLLPASIQTFRLELLLRGDDVVEPETLKERVRNHVLHAFGVAERPLVSSISRSGIVAFVMGIDGVKDVTVRELTRTDTTAGSVHAVLHARETRWDPVRQRIEPAEVLGVAAGELILAVLDVEEDV